MPRGNKSGPSIKRKTMGYIMGYIKIGKGIKAIFDKNTGSVKLYSNNGILQRNWIEHLGVGTEQIKSGPK